MENDLKNLEKARSLLALATKTDSEGEASSAALQLAKLIKKHNLLNKIETPVIIPTYINVPTHKNSPRQVNDLGEFFLMHSFTAKSALIILLLLFLIWVSGVFIGVGITIQYYKDIINNETYNHVHSQ